MLVFCIQTLKHWYSDEIIGKVHPHFTYEAAGVNLGCAARKIGHFFFSPLRASGFTGKKWKAFGKICIGSKFTFGSGCIV